MRIHIYLNIKLRESQTANNIEKTVAASEKRKFYVRLDDCRNFVVYAKLRRFITKPLYRSARPLAKFSSVCVSALAFDRDA